MDHNSLLVFDFTVPCMGFKICWLCMKTKHYIWIQYPVNFGNVSAIFGVVMAINNLLPKSIENEHWLNSTLFGKKLIFYQNLLIL